MKNFKYGDMLFAVVIIVLLSLLIIPPIVDYNRAKNVQVQRKETEKKSESTLKSTTIVKSNDLGSVEVYIIEKDGFWFAVAIKANGVSITQIK